MKFLMCYSHCFHHHCHHHLLFRLASLPPGNITLNHLNTVNKRSDRSVSDFQTGICADAHDTLYTEQIISHTRTALVDTITSVQGSDGSVIATWEVHELLLKIHNMLANAVCKWIADMTHIVSYLFNSVSRQHHESAFLNFPFFIALRIPFLPVRLAIMNALAGP